MLFYWKINLIIKFKKWNNLKVNSNVGVAVSFNSNIGIAGTIFINYMHSGRTGKGVINLIGASINSQTKSFVVQGVLTNSNSQSNTGNSSSNNSSKSSIVSSDESIGSLSESNLTKSSGSTIGGKVVNKLAYVPSVNVLSPKLHYKVSILNFDFISKLTPDDYAFIKYMQRNTSMGARRALFELIKNWAFLNNSGDSNGKLEYVYGSDGRLIQTRSLQFWELAYPITHSRKIYLPNGKINQTKLLRLDGGRSSFFEPSNLFCALKGLLLKGDSFGESVDFIVKQQENQEMLFKLGEVNEFSNPNDLLMSILKITQPFREVFNDHKVSNIKEAGFFQRALFQSSLYLGNTNNFKVQIEFLKHALGGKAALVHFENNKKGNFLIRMFDTVEQAKEFAACHYIKNEKILIVEEDKVIQDAYEKYVNTRVESFKCLRIGIFQLEVMFNLAVKYGGHITFEDFFAALDIENSKSIFYKLSQNVQVNNTDLINSNTVVLNKAITPQELAVSGFPTSSFIFIFPLFDFDLWVRIFHVVVLFSFLLFIFSIISKRCCILAIKFIEYLQYGLKLTIQNMRDLFASFYNVFYTNFLKKIIIFLFNKIKNILLLFKKKCLLIKNFFFIKKDVFVQKFFNIDRYSIEKNYTKTEFFNKLSGWKHSLNKFLFSKIINLENNIIVPEEGLQYMCSRELHNGNIFSFFIQNKFFIKIKFFFLFLVNILFDFFLFVRVTAHNRKLVLLMQFKVKDTSFFSEFILLRFVLYFIMFLSVTSILVLRIFFMILKAVALFFIVASARWAYLDEIDTGWAKCALPYNQENRLNRIGFLNALKICHKYVLFLLKNAEFEVAVTYCLINLSKEVLAKNMTNEVFTYVDFNCIHNLCAMNVIDVQFSYYDQNGNLSLLFNITLSLDLNIDEFSTENIKKLLINSYIFKLFNEINKKFTNSLLLKLLRQADLVRIGVIEAIDILKQERFLVESNVGVNDRVSDYLEHGNDRLYQKILNKRYHIELKNNINYIKIRNKVLQEFLKTNNILNYKENELIEIIDELMESNSEYIDLKFKK